MSKDNMKKNSRPPERGRDREREPEYDPAPKTRTWGFAAGAVLLLAILTVVLCVMGGVFDFNKGAATTDVPAAGTQAPQQDASQPPEETPAETAPEETEPAKTHTVNAIAGNGGSISPSGIVEVEDGGSVTFNIKADAGYVLYELKVDGYTAEPSGSYTFTDVTGEHTIYAIFREDVPETPTPPPQTAQPVVTDRPDPTDEHSVTGDPTIHDVLD